MLLQGMFQNLHIARNAPHTDLTVNATTHNAEIATLVQLVGNSEGRDSAFVGIIDGIDQATAFRSKCPDFTVIPA